MFLSIPPPREPSSGLTPASLLQKLPASPTKFSLQHEYCFSKAQPSLWSFLPQKSVASKHPKKNIQTPANVNWEIPYSDYILFFLSHLLLLAPRNVNHAGLHQALPPSPAFAVPSAHNNLVVFLYLGHLSSSVLGSARVTPSSWSLLQPTLLFLPPFLSLALSLHLWI